MISRRPHHASNKNETLWEIVTGNTGRPTLATQALINSYDGRNVQSTTANGRVRRDTHQTFQRHHC